MTWNSWWKIGLYYNVFCFVLIICHLRMYSVYNKFKEKKKVHAGRYSGLSVQGKLNIYQVYMWYVSEPVGKLYVMQFRADLGNLFIMSCRPPLCLQCKKLAFLFWIINDHRTGNESDLSDQPKTNYLWFLSSRFTCTYSMYYSGAKQKCFLSSRLKGPLV